MNILVGAPNANFDLDYMKAQLNSDKRFNNEQLWFADQNLTAQQLEKIDVFLGYDQALLDKILADDNSHLKFIQALSVGVDYLPVARLKERGIKLASVKGVNAEPMAETITGMILGQYRHLDDFARINKWEKIDASFRVLAGKTALLFGTGSVGARTAELLKAYRVHTVGVNTHGREVTNFDTTMAMDNLDSSVFDADIIINSLPLTNETNGYFNYDFFKKLRKRPLFINVGRGNSVVTADLIKGLQSGNVGAVALDVVDPEPLPDDSPLWGMDNVYISPHVSALYDDFIKNSFDIFNANLKQYEDNGDLVKNEL